MIVFISIFLIAYLVGEAGLYYSYCQNKSSNAAKYEESCDETAKSLCDLFGSSLSAAVQMGNTLFSQRWFLHLRNSLGYYDSEFDAQTKAETVQNFSRLAASMTYVSDLVMILPQRDIVISKNGWFTISSYTKIYPSLSIQITDTEFHTCEVQGSKPLILLSDPTANKAGCCLVIVLDAASFEKAFADLLPETVSGAEASLDGKVVFSIGGNDSDALVIKKDYSYPSLSVKYIFQPYHYSYALNAFLLLSLVLFLGFVVIGLLLAYRTFKPVHQLVLASGGAKSDFEEPYDYVQSYISRMKAAQAQLITEGADKEEKLNHLQERMRSDVLYSVLTSRPINLMDPLIGSLFPWVRDDRKAFLLSLPVTGDGILQPEQADLLCAVAHCVQASTSEGTFALLWLKNDMSREEKAEYARMLRRQWGKVSHSLCFASGIFSVPGELGEAGALLQKEMTEGVRIRSSLPSDIRAHLSELLPCGSEMEIASLVQSLKEHYEPCDFLNAAYAAAEEEIKAEENVTWDDAQDMIANLMKKEEAQAAEPPEEAKKYVEYVDTCFADSELSVSSVADHFKKHRTIISKEIKRLTGYSFSDYLRVRRIEEALSRIADGESSIMQIANDVGFVSYSTFKRAFIQHTGKTPLEYRNGGTESETKN